MNSRDKLFDASVVRLRQMYLEEKVNANPNFVLFENEIFRIEKKSFLNGAFYMSFPNCFQEIARENFENDSNKEGIVPFALVRASSGNMSASFYQVEPYSDKESICDSFIRLYTKKMIDNTGVCKAKNCKVNWFDYRKTSGSILSYTQIFSFNIKESLIIGQMSCHLSQYESCKKLMKKLLETIDIRLEEENERT